MGPVFCKTTIVFSSVLTMMINLLAFCHVSDCSLPAKSIKYYVFLFKVEEPAVMKVIPVMKVMCARPTRFCYYLPRFF